MADIDLKTATPDTTLPTTGFLFGADSQAAASPSVFTVQSVATTLLGSTTLTGATVTTSQPVIDASQTWNDGGVTFTGLKFNATDTASASGSLLMDLQVNGVSQARVNKAGSISATSFSFLTGTLSGQVNGLNITTGTDLSYRLTTSLLRVRSDGAFAWVPDTNVTGAADLFLTRRAAANLRLGAADAAGSASAVTIDFATNANNITWTSHGLMTGSAVMFSAVSFPTSSSGNLNGTTTYYAVVVNANTIQIARTYDAAVSATPTVIAFTGNGTTVTARGAKTEQTLSVQNFTGTDMPGSPLVFDSAQGTGAGVGGPILFRIAPAGSSGSLQNALETLLTINPNRTVDIGGLTINPANGGTTFQQTFAITMQTSNAFVIRHGNSDGLDVRPVSSGSPNILLKNASNAIQAALWGEATNTLALRNGANAQTFRVYNTYNGTNDEWGTFDFSTTANNLTIGSMKSGTGANRVVRFVAGGTRFAVSDGSYFQVDQDFYPLGNVFMAAKYTEMSEMTAPAAPAANKVRIYAEDDGNGKTRLMARFATGAAVQIAIEP